MVVNGKGTECGRLRQHRPKDKDGNGTVAPVISSRDPLLWNLLPTPAEARRGAWKDLCAQLGDRWGLFDDSLPLEWISPANNSLAGGLEAVSLVR